MRACIVAVALLVAAGTAAGEESERVLAISKVQQVGMLSDSEWGKAFALIGHVTLEVEGVFRLRAQRFVVWLDPKADTKVFDLVKGLQSDERRVPIWAVRAIYAQGGRAPAIFHAGERIFRCKELFFDFTTHKGVLIDAEMRLQRNDESLGPLPDLAMRAKRIYARGPGRWTARDVRLFASSYYRPEVSIGIDRIELHDEKAGAVVAEIMRVSSAAAKKGVGVPRETLDQLLEKLSAATLDDPVGKVEFFKVTAHAFAVPFFKWNKVSADREATVKVRGDLQAGKRGLLGTGFMARAGIEDKPVSFMAGLGWYEHRGPAADLRLRVDAFDGALRGHSYGVYLRDEGTVNGLPPPSPNRFYTKNQYRWLIDDVWRLDGEYSDLSDAQFLRLWEPQQFYEGKRLETLLHLRGRNETGYLSGLIKVRTIEFFNEVEKLPRFVASLPVLTLIEFSERIALQLAGEMQAGNLRARRSDLLPPGPEPRTWRFDTDPRLYLSFNAGPVRVVPFAEFRFTAYDDSPTGATLGRFVGTAGIRGDMQLSRWYGSTRHAVNITLEYTDVYDVSRSGSELFQFDDVDQITPWEGVGIRLRNRLQRATSAGLETFLTFEIFGMWFPQGRQPLGALGDSFVDMNLAWWKRDQVGILFRTDIDTEHGILRTGSIEGWVQARRNIVLGGSLRHLEGDSDIFTFNTEFEVDTRWRVLLYSQYDFKNDDALQQGLLVQRFGKTAMVGFDFIYNPGNGGFSFSFNIDLTEAFRKKIKRNRNDYRREFYFR